MSHAFRATGARTGRRWQVEGVLEPAPAVAGRTERDLAILVFEKKWWRSAGAKEEAIRAEFALSAARYYQLLAVVIDSPWALAQDPMLVKRLRRMREARASARAGRSLSAYDQ
ncbi:uncharacterized protein DUF3263 [Cryobacterium psychrophilum]|nr:uncharacterized protein DUF3263 [Cryobacterium psychrophilum]